MGITQEKVKAMMDEACKSVREGQPVDQSSATSCARVLKLSVFFQNEQRSWQLGIILLCAGVADRLHWSVIGAPSRGVSRLILSGLVDPTALGGGTDDAEFSSATGNVAVPR